MDGPIGALVAIVAFIFGIFCGVGIGGANWQNDCDVGNSHRSGQSVYDCKKRN